MKVLPV